MKQKFKCPMMCGMNMMYQPDLMDMQPEMPMAEDLEMDNFYEDEEDDKQFMRMYPESCRNIMIYVKLEIDRMEEKDKMMHDGRPDREMVDMLTDNAYKKMVKEMPEMAELEETRQYPGRRFSRDLLRILLLNELFRRRRRRRRRDYYGYPSGGYDYDYYDYD
jgi:hypothetical protein